MLRHSLPNTRYTANMGWGVVLSLIAFTSVLQATNCYILSSNGQIRYNTTRPINTNHDDKTNNNLQYYDKGNNITAIVANSVDKFTLRVYYDITDDPFINSKYRDFGFRFKRDTTGRQGPSSTRSSSRTRGSSRTRNPPRRRPSTGSQTRCQTGSSTRRTSSSTRRRTRPSSSRRRTGSSSSQAGSSSQCKEIETEETEEAEETEEINTPTLEESIQDSETQLEEENDDTCPCCPTHHRGRSKRQAKCDTNALSTDKDPLRENIFESLKTNIGKDLPSGKKQQFFDIFQKIQKDDDLSTKDLILALPGQKAEMFSLEDGDSSQQIKKLRNAWRMNKDVQAEYDNFMNIVKKMPEMKGIDTKPLTEKAMKHIFYGEETPGKKKGKLQFSGLHDGNAFFGLYSHKITGGTVDAVTKVGPGVAVDISNLKVSWNGGKDIREKHRTTIFIGVPPKYQAAFYLATYHDKVQSQNDHDVTLKDGTKKHTGAVIAEMQEDPTQDPFRIQVVKNMDTGEFITAYPFIPPPSTPLSSSSPSPSPSPTPLPLPSPSPPASPAPPVLPASASSPPSSIPSSSPPSSIPSSPSP